jgi:transglutaminase-like putative cysteine protease
MLVRMNGHIGQTLRYEVRHEEGTQPALTTLDLGRGTCRDVAFLMIEALRQLGIAARFVSGYLYDASLDDDVGPAASGKTELARPVHTHVIAPTAGIETRFSSLTWRAALVS